MDLLLYGLVALGVAWIVIKIAWFTVKRVATNVALGIATYVVATEIFHITVEMNLMVWALTAVLGPIPVIAIAYWNW